MTRANERGSVVGFVAVGLLLTALLVGAVYGTKHYLGAATNGAEEVATTAGDESKDTSDSSEEKSNDKKADEQQAEQEAEKQKAEAEQKQAEERAAQQREQQKAEKEQQAEAENNDSVVGDDDEEEDLPQTGVTALPQTGPIDDIMASALMLSLLAGAYVAYRRSHLL